jgi:hypothetical protein
MSLASHSHYADDDMPLAGPIAIPFLAKIFAEQSQDSDTAEG